MQNKCLILGGGGFIGSHLVDSLVKYKYQVTVLSYSPDQDNKNLFLSKDKIKIVKGSFENKDLLSRIIQPDMYVFNLVSTSIPATSLEKVVDSIKPQINLIEVCSAKKIRKLIFASTGGGIYGDKQKLPITEKTIPHPASPHAIGKITIEYFLHYFGKISNLNYLIYRFSNPYGPRQTPKTGFGLIPTLFEHVLAKNTPVLYDNGNAIRDFIYIQDLVDAVTNSFSKENHFDTYNIGSGKGTRIIDVWKNIAEITQTKTVPLLKPRRKFDVKKYYLNTNRFTNEYKYKPKIDLETGLKKTWQWILTETKYNNIDILSKSEKEK